MDPKRAIVYKTRLAKLYRGNKNAIHDTLYLKQTAQDGFSFC